MRIISGKYKGLKLVGDNIEGTRPTMDRVKESLFGIIQNNIRNSTCLDLFAGSGSLGIEALSNGAHFCYFVDNNIKVIDVLNKNTKNIEKKKIIKNDYINALKYFKDNNIKFDIVFLDPPYKLNLINNSLKYLKEYNLLNDNALIICEYEKEEFNIDFDIIKEKKYGSKLIRIYKYKLTN